MKLEGLIVPIKGTYLWLIFFSFSVNGRIPKLKVKSYSWKSKAQQTNC